MSAASTPFENESITAIWQHHYHKLQDATHLSTLIEFLQCLCEPTSPHFVQAVHDDLFVQLKQTTINFAEQKLFNKSENRRAFAVASEPLRCLPTTILMKILRFNSTLRDVAPCLIVSKWLKEIVTDPSNEIISRNQAIVIEATETNPDPEISFRETTIHIKFAFGWCSHQMPTNLRPLFALATAHKIHVCIKARLQPLQYPDRDQLMNLVKHCDSIYLTTDYFKNLTATYQENWAAREVRVPVTAWRAVTQRQFPNVEKIHLNVGSSLQREPPPSVNQPGTEELIPKIVSVRLGAYNRHIAEWLHSNGKFLKHLNRIEVQKIGSFGDTSNIAREWVVPPVNRFEFQFDRNVMPADQMQTMRMNLSRLKLSCQDLGLFPISIMKDKTIDSLVGLVTFLDGFERLTTIRMTVSSSKKVNVEAEIDRVLMEWSAQERRMRRMPRIEQIFISFSYHSMTNYDEQNVVRELNRFFRTLGFFDPEFRMTPYRCFSGHFLKEYQR